MLNGHRAFVAQFLGAGRSIDTRAIVHEKLHRIMVIVHGLSGTNGAFSDLITSPGRLRPAQTPNEPHFRADERVRDPAGSRVLSPPTGRNAI